MKNKSKKQFKPIVIILMTLLCIFTDSLSPIRATADDDADLFGEMEDIIQKDEDKSSSDDASDLFAEMANAENDQSRNEKWPILKKAVQNFEGSLKLSTLYYFRDATPRSGLDTHNEVNEALLKYTTWTGTDTLSLHVSGWLETGSQKETWKGHVHWMQDRDYYRRHVECNELYLLLNRKSYDITAGKKIVNNGLSALYSPANRFKAFDLHDPVNPKEFGIWQVMLDKYIRDTQLSFAVFPIYMEIKRPAFSSRMWGDIDEDILIQSALIDAQDEFPVFDEKYIGSFARLKKSIAGWDLFVNAHSGTNPYDVIREHQDVQISTTIRTTSVGTGFSTTFKSLELHGESLVNYSENHKDDDYVNAVLGFTYTTDALFFENTVFTLEYAREKIIEKQNAATYTQSSIYARQGVDDLFAKLKLIYDKDLNLEFFTHYEIDEKAGLFRFNTKYRLTGALSFSIAVEYFEILGDRDKSYQSDGIVTIQNLSHRDRDKNDRITADLQYDF